MRFLVLLVLLVAMSGCMGRNTPSKTETIAGIPCYVVLAQCVAADNQLIEMGPYYSKERPQTDWQNGDVQFVNMETQKPILIPGTWTIRVSHGYKY